MEFLSVSYYGVNVESLYFEHQILMLKALFGENVSLAWLQSMRVLNLYWSHLSEFLKKEPKKLNTNLIITLSICLTNTIAGYHYKQDFQRVTPSVVMCWRSHIPIDKMNCKTQLSWCYDIGICGFGESPETVSSTHSVSATYHTTEMGVWLIKRITCLKRCSTDGDVDFKDGYEMSE